MSVLSLKELQSIKIITEFEKNKEYFSLRNIIKQSILT